ncbi:MAG: hypothetical protein ACOC1K_00130 [Nanoarchaeota archaeon]
MDKYKIVISDEFNEFEDMLNNYNESLEEIFNSLVVPFKFLVY